MNIIQKGKRQLMILSIVLLVIGLGLFGGGIALFVSGCIGISAGVEVVIIVLKMVGGALMFALGALAIVVAIIMLWTGGAVKAFSGSLAEGNLAMGTANMIKCPKCGSQVKEGDEVCGNCGKSLKKTKVCKECGTENPSNKKYCSNCGKEL